jgi:hypothetical protein
MLYIKANTNKEDNKMENYTLTYKLSNKKITAVASVSFSERTCLRAAEIEFQKNGFSTHGKYAVYFTNGLLKQKNYIGKAPIYQEL